VEQLTFSGNVVEVTRVEGNRAYIRSYDASQRPPLEAIKPTEFNLHPLVQLFTTQYKKWLDMSTGGRWPRTLIIANAGEELWIDVAELAPYQPAARTVKVTAVPWLNVRTAASTSAAVVGRKLPGAVCLVTQTATIGANVWGKVAEGWIALRFNGQFYTDWKI
jgi:hypothetical protein